MKDMNRNVRHMEGLRNILIRGLGGRLNGPGGKSMPKRLCSNVNVSFGGIEGEVLVAKLSKMGVCISTGSACASRAAGQSHVLKAAGLGGKEMMGSVRYTVSRLNTKEEVAVSIEKTKAALEQLREIYSSSRILA